MDKFFLDKFFNIFFPAKCGFCGNITESFNFVCRECESKKYNEDREHCILCGKKVYLEKNICNKCREGRVYYDKLLYYDEYKEVLKDRIVAYKFSGNSYLCNFFAELTAVKLLKEKADFITSVPISKKRMIERGYNQSELIAKKLSKLLDIPYKKLLLKVKETKRQSQLSRIERAINVRDSFEVIKKTDLKNKRIILLDDVFTTGSTVNECSRVLKLSNVSEIKVAVIAIRTEKF